MVYRNGSPLITTLQVQSVNLTWDAYQALPSTKLTDGVYYNITDITQSTLDICNTLSGENTLLKARVAELEAKNVYSTDEKVVGTWIDGKPLYRRIIETTNKGTGNFSVSVSIPNIDNMIHTEGQIKSTTGTYANMFFCIPRGSEEIRYEKNNNLLYLSGRNTAVNADYVLFIIEYTKTTD